MGRRIKGLFLHLRLPKGLQDYLRPIRIIFKNTHLSLPAFLCSPPFVVIVIVCRRRRFRSTVGFTEIVSFYYPLPLQSFRFAPHVVSLFTRQFALHSATILPLFIISSYSFFFYRNFWIDVFHLFLPGQEEVASFFLLVRCTRKFGRSVQPGQL